MNAWKYIVLNFSWIIEMGFDNNVQFDGRKQRLFNQFYEIGSFNKSVYMRLNEAY